MDTSAGPSLLPLSIADVFDESFDLYKRNFARFAGIVAVIHVPTFVAINCLMIAMGWDRLNLTAHSSADAQVAEVMGRSIVLLGVTMVYGLALILESGALSVAISESYLGRSIGVGTAYRRASSSFLALVITWFLITVFVGSAGFMAMMGAFVFLALLLGILAGASGAAGDTIFGVILVFLMIAAPFLVALVFVVWLALFVTQITTIEGTGYVSSIVRNFNLVRGRFWPIFGGSLLLGLIGLALTVAFNFTVTGALELLVYPWLHLPVLAQKIIAGVWSTLVTLLIQPYYLVFVTVLYYDQRVRREGFDLTLLENAVRPAQASEAVG